MLSPLNRRFNAFVVDGALSVTTLSRQLLKLHGGISIDMLLPGVHMNKHLKIALLPGRPGPLSTPLRLLLATTAAFWMGAARADGPYTPVSGQAIELRFRDFFRMPVGAGGLSISETLQRANGQKVRLVGYMVQQDQPVPGQFLLSPRPVQMSEHADGEADDLPPATVLVQLDPAQRDWVVPYVPGLVAVNGVIDVKRHEALDGRVHWVRLQLAADAARQMNAADLTGYLHLHRREAGQ